MFRRLLLGGSLFLLAAATLPGVDAPPKPGPSTEQTTPDAAVPSADQQTRVQHLSGLGVDRWHRKGFRGQGLKVAILDTGFRGYRSFLGSILPAQVTSRSFRRDGDLEAKDSQHGILCGEVIHALAPAAELLLANWETDDPGSFVAAVRWAKTQGARIVSCSVIMPSWSDGEGNGPVHARLYSIMGDGKSAADLLCFASAGNIAQRHWAGSFTPDRNGYHQWSAGRTRNRLIPWGRDRVSVELYGTLASSLELEVRDGSTGALVGSARTRPGSEETSAVVRFYPQGTHTYHIALKGDAEAARRDKFHLVVLGGSLDRSTARGSVAFPGDGKAVHAVGAVDEDYRRLFYSSCGPNSSCPKPDFVAPVPFPSSWRDRPFAGTSAAAPQAAALAALLWSRYPDWTAARVSSALRQAARDLCEPGHDCETGYGVIRLPE
jgi:subtilisin family serine protease